MPNRWPHTQLYGADVDEGLLNWNRKRLPQIAHWETNEYSPPSVFDSGTFDLVYAVSVFTHMDEKGQLSWLEEFRRILRPGGLVLLTVIPMNESDEQGSWEFHDTRGMVYGYRRHDVVKRSWLKHQSEIPAISIRNIRKTTAGPLGAICSSLAVSFAGALRGYQALVVLRKAAQANLEC